MAIVKNENELRRLEAIEKHDHANLIEKRNRRIIALLDSCHKINFFHKLKEKIYGKCKICKEMESLR